MRALALLAALTAAIALAACGEKQAADALPQPHELTASAIGKYCGMNLMEHAGPKGQIILASGSEPVWFSSARDAFAFTMLPEEPKDFRAIYVSDMAKAPSWDKPGTTNWVDARQAFFVIGSRMKGGMGTDEAVPFSEGAAAERFSVENGGRVVRFADVPRDYVLGAGETTSATPQADASEGHQAQGHAH